LEVDLDAPLDALLAVFFEAVFAARLREAAGLAAEAFLAVGFFEGFGSAGVACCMA
jgi:hypothetical protein